MQTKNMGTIIKKATKATNASKTSKTSRTTKAIQKTNDPLIGKKLSGLKIPMTGGKIFDGANYKGQRLILYFYPKDMTPGCTQEGHDFTALIKEFKKLNTVILGVSRDSINKHNKFIEKENYKVDLISDEEEKACQWFDVIKEKNMYGKKTLGIERSTFLINEAGVVEYVWRKVKVDGHAQAVLEHIKSLI